MDPQTDLPDLVEDLEVNIDELSAVLSPLLNTSLSTTASSLPLLDKAKLYVLAAYSIESLLYSTLQASGVNAKEHAIFKELGRLKGYFGKIKNVEERAIVPSVPKAKLDVGAAARFIKHGLAGNDKYDLERAERMAKERARAHLKAQQINKKFDEDGEEKTKPVTPQKRDVEDMETEEPEDEDVLEGLEEPETISTTTAEPANKKPKLSGTDPMDIDTAPSPTTSQSQSDSKKKRKKRGKKQSKPADPSESQQDAETPEDEANDATPEESQPTSPPKKKRRQRGKKAQNTDAEDTSQEGKETGLSTRAPKTRSETFNALLDGSLPEKQKRGRGRPKGKGK